MLKIENGIIEGNLHLTEDNLSEFINNLTNIKQINGYLWLSNLHLTELPYMSNIIINGHFYCFNNQLTSLIGCPNEIGGVFNCSYNKLTNLIGCTKEINGDFYCHCNNLTSLEGCPKIIKGEAFFDKDVILSKEILNLINNLILDKGYLNKEDVLSKLREIQLNKILNE